MSSTSTKSGRLVGLFWGKSADDLEQMIMPICSLGRNLKLILDLFASIACTGMSSSDTSLLKMEPGAPSSEQAGQGY